jgi:hypothetical protein
MNVVNGFKGQRVKWEGMRSWKLGRPAAPSLATTLPRLPVDDSGRDETVERLFNYDPESLEDSEVSGQGSGEGGRDGLRRPAPWSLAQAPGAKSSHQPSALSPGPQLTADD